MSPSALEQEEQEEQYPIEQTICGTLQKENNWKCFILTTLILGCLAAVSWCRFTHVTKVVINFSLYPIRSARQMSPCEEGYIYIPVAFMAMLYLVYLVECWHCTARVQLGYREDASTVLHKVHQMRQALPIVWWKAVCYHYVRRKRQVTRYRNGDSFTSTQVYYERVNSHAAGTSFVFAYCGVKDISRKLVLHHTKGPITKIRFSKGFAFANVAAAAEFEEQRSRFFADQERHDDYMEMREGLDLTDVTGFREHVVALTDPDRPPWYARAPVFWLCSFLLLSWPLRILLEYNTAYVHYQVTKLFGVNYDATTSVATTPSLAPQVCLSRGGQMSHGTSMADSTELEWCIRENVTLVPSYSEALLMANDGHLPQCHVPNDGHLPQCHVPNAMSSYSVRTVAATTNNNNITNSEQMEECPARRSWGSILNFHAHRSSWSRASAQFETTLIRSSTQTRLPLYYASPLVEIYPSDPFRGRPSTTAEEPPPYDEALRFPALTRLRRSLTDRAFHAPRRRSSAPTNCAALVCHPTVIAPHQVPTATTAPTPPRPRTLINMETSL
ncbi:transmembrane protein 151A [Nilaparvata lugens]|uniref:transmembrane protein 151A n=1 Tax=Nilaparvata lugens TaxID=108931 RepID=UPI00193D6267|nr:transmembrane protein 151A [Nilaparvata lugens]